MFRCTIEAPIVKIKQGYLRGAYEKDYRGGWYYSFKGIPFAEPPIGILRFKSPRPPKNWEGIRDALSLGDPCRHQNLITDLWVGSEDCLYVNVFSKRLPKENNSALLPVLFFVHGGAFEKGSNSYTGYDLYGPGYLLAEDIVLVTTNYRLGALGSLGFTDPKIDVPGNNGLKDVVASLRWVHANINSFGGNPNNIMIFGESAGSVTCHYLHLSPMARGLFHKSIMMSGCSAGSWTHTTTQPELLARVLGYKGDEKDQKSIYEFLLTIPVDALIYAELKQRDEPEYNGGVLIWAPIIEVTGCPTEPNFLTRPPLEILKSGDVPHIPVMFGFNSGEGLLMTGKESPGTFKAIMETRDYEQFVPPTLGLKKGSKESKKAGEVIQKFYYGDHPPTKENFVPFVNFSSDVIFVHATTVAAKYHAKFSSAPVYIYRFDVDLPFSVIKTAMLGIFFPGCTHSEELGYIFQNFAVPFEDNSPGGKTVYRFRKFWTNFAKTGNPNSRVADPVLNVHWKPFTTKEMNYLNLGLEVEVKRNPESARVEFWNNLLKSHGKEVI